MVVATRNGILSLDTATGKLSKLADAPYDTAIVRFNDGRCDPTGRLWVGTLYEPKDKPGGSLYCFERGRLRDVGISVTVSNGLAFSRDHRTMYHADTTLHRIVAYEFEAVSGNIAGSRLFKQFEMDRSQNYGGRPDGAAVDSEDAYWCAMYEGSRLLRISPAGDILEEIPLPVRCPTMIAFGGDDFRTLYVTTARQNQSAEQLTRHPLSGRVLEISVNVPGLPESGYVP